MKVPAQATLRFTSRPGSIFNAVFKATYKSIETQAVPNNELPLPSVSDVGIRKHLQLWQERQANEQDLMTLPTGLNEAKQEPTASSIVASVEDDGVGALIPADGDSYQEEAEPYDHGITEEGETLHSRFLSCGDVVQCR
ncbi:MAG: hypothetical protein Q9174_002723 [Haloplaca sp. 1 TL-2023]